MQTDQQGLYLVTIICSLVSLLSVMFILLTCAITKIWRKGSNRLVMYLCLTSIVSSLNIILPTYKYSFMCQFQAQLLNFCIFTDLIFGVLLLHFCYLRIVEEKKFTRLIEIRYIGIALIPSLIVSLPPMYPQTIDDNCWSGENSPLQEVLASFGFFIPYYVGFIASLWMILSVVTYLKLYPSGFCTEEYEKKIDKISYVGKFALLIYGSYFFLSIYSALLITSENTRALDFISMFCYASAGTFYLGLFLSSKRIKASIKDHFKTHPTQIGLLPEDQSNFEDEIIPSSLNE
jgi:hypothetical protein